jgi:zona occludens toxin (predicted ATPase)
MLTEAEETEKALKAWGETVVEVPGYEHDHSHDKEGEGHHHHSHDRIETTPEQMIAIQKDLRDKVEAIKNRVQELVNKMKM